MFQQSEWVVERLCNELRYMSDRGSRDVNTDLLMAYIDLLKQRALTLSTQIDEFNRGVAEGHRRIDERDAEIQRLNSVIEDAAMVRLGEAMKKAEMPPGTYHISEDEAPYNEMKAQEWFREPLR